MKPLTLIYVSFLTLVTTAGCSPGSNQAAESQPTGSETLLLEGPAIVAILPDSLQMERLKKEWGEQAFYTYANDQVWYDDQLETKAKLSDIQLVRTTNRNLILTDNQDLHLPVDTSSLTGEWGHYFYYRPEQGLAQMTIDELFEQLETENPTVRQVGLIIEDATARQMPGFEQPQAFQLTAGQSVSLKEVKQIENDQEDENAFCYQNTWVRIQTEDDRAGWIFGKFVGRIEEKSNMIDGYSGFQVMLDDEIYNVLLAGNYTIGAFVEGEGLTGCEEFYPLVFMRNYYQDLELIRIDGHPNSDYPFARLISDEGAEEKITAAETQGDHVLFYVSATYQEGSGSYTLEVRREGGNLVGQIKDYQRGWE
jgi:hypothetical protein